MTDGMPSGYFPELAAYLDAGLDQVEGWLSPTTAAMLAASAVRQTLKCFAGDLCEIGVHHGKLFLILGTAARPGERAVAVDLFDDQQRNIDRSGAGNRSIFERHCGNYAPNAAIDIMQGSSMDLGRTGFVDRRFRLFSIDGGHTAEITANDLRLAERTLLPGGIVALDDILSHHWTGVITGLNDYLHEGGTLIPYALVPNKLLLTTDPALGSQHASELCKTFPRAWTKTSDMLGHSVEVFDETEYYARNQSRGLHFSLALEREESARLREKLSEAGSETVTVAAELARVRSELAGLRASTSWRVTAPLRAMRRILS